MNNGKRTCADCTHLKRPLKHFMKVKQSPLAHVIGNDYIGARLYLDEGKCHCIKGHLIKASGNDRWYSVEYVNRSRDSWDAHMDAEQCPDRDFEDVDLEGITLVLSVIGEENE